MPRLRRSTPARDLHLDASGSVVNAAILQAGNALTLTAATLVNDAGSLTADASLALTTGSLGNQVGRIDSSGSLTITAASLDNRAGTVVATGDATLALTAGTTALVNDHGSIGSTTGALSLTSAGDASNVGGTLVGTTRLDLSAHALDNTTGSVGSNAGAATLHVQALHNDGGLLQAHTDLQLDATTLSNISGGRIVADRDAHLTLAGDLDNRTGSINASTLTIVSGGTLANDHGTITAGDSATIDATALIGNVSGRIGAVRALTLDLGSGTLANAGGTIVAGVPGGVASALHVASGALDNTGGTLASVTGTLALTTHGQTLVNDAGRIQSLGDLTIVSGAASNQNGGQISGQNLNLNVGDLVNAGGTVLARGTLQLDATSLDNRAGLVQSGGDLTLSTHGGSLDNRASGSTGGIVSFGRLTLDAGSLDNRAGFISAVGDATLTTAQIDNRAGAIGSGGDLHLSATTAIDNRGGRIAATGDLSATTPSFDNSAESAGAAGTVSARDIHFDVTTLVNSGGGSIAARRDADLQAVQFDNRGGTASAKGALGVTAPTLQNDGGSLIGDQLVRVTTASSAPGGSIASVNSVDLTIQGDFDNTGLLSAKNSLTLHATNVANSATGTLHADGTLTIGTGQLVNAGEISATTTNVTATGLSNTGLIDGTTTTVQAASLVNTGRIYGDQLAVGGGTLVNTTTGAIAARANLEIGATSLTNSEGGNIRSLGDIAIGGSIDANGQAQGSMTSLVNASSTIEATRDLTITTGTLTNRNDHVVVGSRVKVEAVDQLLIAPDYDPNARYTPDQLGWFSSYEGVGVYVRSSATYPFAKAGSDPKASALTNNCTSQSTDQIGTPCTESPVYASTDPIWALFQITNPDPTGARAPQAPGSSGCMIIPNSDGAPAYPDQSGACGDYWTAKSSYDASMYAASQQLEGAIDAFNQDLYNRHFDAWAEIRITSRTTTEPYLVSSSPAQLLAGRDLTLIGSGAMTNQTSYIIAGGALLGRADSVTSTGTDAIQTVTDTEESRHRRIEYHGGFSDSYESVYTDWSTVPSVPTPTTVSIGRFVPLDHGGAPGLDGVPGGTTVAGNQQAGNGIVADAASQASAAAIAAAAAAAQLAGAIGTGNSSNVTIGTVAPGTAQGTLGTGKSRRRPRRSHERQRRGRPGDSASHRRSARQRRRPCRHEGRRSDPRRIRPCLCPRRRYRCARPDGNCRHRRRSDASRRRSARRLARQRLDRARRVGDQRLDRAAHRPRCRSHRHARPRSRRGHRCRRRAGRRRPVRRRPGEPLGHAQRPSRRIGPDHRPDRATGRRDRQRRTRP